MTFKQSVIWTKVIDKLPEDGKSYLVWTGKEMVVSCAHVYDDAHKQRMIEVAESHEKMGGENNIEIAQSLRSATGKFADFGVHWYFDNPEVQYAELPLAPGEMNPPESEQSTLSSRDVYLKKDGRIVGIHAVGDQNPENPEEFWALDIWGNEYDEDHNMLGRGSFRVFDSLENEVKNWEADGWVRYEGPERKT